MVLSDITIKHLAIKHGMINPFYPKSMSLNERGQKVTSYGLTSYGYDIRLGRNFLVYRGTENFVVNYTRNGVHESMLVESFKSKFKDDPIIDPNNFDSRLVVQIDDVDEIWFPPRTFFMGVSQEYIKVPRDVKVICDSKSTCARSALVFFVTPLEPEWQGYITLEFNNSSDAILKLTSGMGISQLSFQRGDTPCETSYADRNGKYNNQGDQPIPPLQKL